jgi:hypothetical protein
MRQYDNHYDCRCICMPLLRTNRRSSVSGVAELLRRNIGSDDLKLPPVSKSTLRIRNGHGSLSVKYRQPCELSATRLALRPPTERILG